MSRSKAVALGATVAGAVLLFLAWRTAWQDHDSLIAVVVGTGLGLLVGAIGIRLLWPK